MRYEQSFTMPEYAKGLSQIFYTSIFGSLKRYVNRNNLFKQISRYGNAMNARTSEFYSLWYLWFIPEYGRSNKPLLYWE